MGSATSNTQTDPEAIVVTTLRIQRGLLDRFNEMAEAHQRSQNQEFRWLVKQAVDAYEKEAA
jgi:hypothetical protein